MKSRHILGILGFLGFANVYAMRVNLSVAIVAMINNTAIPDIPDNDTFNHCPMPPGYENDTTPTVKIELINFVVSLNYSFREMGLLYGTKPSRG